MNEIRIAQICQLGKIKLGVNIGDYFSYMAIRRFFKKYFKEIKFKLFRPYIDFGELKNYDYVILGGGGVYNNWMQRLYNYASLGSLKGRFSILGVGLNYGENEKMTESSIEHIKKLNNAASVSSCRDLATFHFLKKLGYSPVLTGCFSLFYPKLLNIPLNKERKKIGVCLAHHVPICSSKRTVILQKKILDLLNEEVILIAHERCDYKFYRENFKNHEIFYSRNPEEVYNKYSRLKYIIGMRGHSNIFAMATNTPSIAIQYNIKVSGPQKLYLKNNLSKLVIHLGANKREMLDKINFLNKNYDKIQKAQLFYLDKLNHNAKLAVSKIIDSLNLKGCLRKNESCGF